MSVKIYDGLKYKYKDLNDVGKFHRKLINIIQEHYSLIYNQKMSCFCLDVVLTVIAFHSSDLKSYINSIVDRHFYCFNDEAVSDHVSERVVEAVMNVLEKEDWEDDDFESLFSLIKSIATTMNFLFVTDSIFKHVIQTKISLYYNDDYVLFIPHDDTDSSGRGSGGILHQRLLKISGVEEYEYQNSTDKPDDISEENWEKRYDEWKIASSSFQQDMNFSNCSEIVIDNPNQTNIIPIMYTTNKDNDPYYLVTKEFIQLIFSRFDNSVASIFKLKMESKVDISSIDQSKGWMQSYKYMNRMTNYMVKVNQEKHEEFIGLCTELFVPLFRHFEMDKE